MQIDEYLTKYDSLASEEAFFRIPLRKEYLLSQIGRGKRVLDVGCMGGQISRLIQEQNNEVWGVEINERAAAEAIRRGIRVKVADVEKGLPFDSASFDVVYAGELLEHLYDTRTFFLDAHRVLKQEGTLLFSTPNLNSFENRMRVIKGDYLSNVGAYPEDHHGQNVRIFNLSKIREICYSTGFEIKDVRGIFTEEPSSKLLSIPLGLASRLIPGFAKFLMVKARKNSGMIE